MTFFFFGILFHFERLGLRGQIRNGNEVSSFAVSEHFVSTWQYLIYLVSHIYQGMELHRGRMGREWICVPLTEREGSRQLDLFQIVCHISRQHDQNR